MTIRTFQSGDELALSETYNAAAGGLPNFEPVHVDQLRRRARSREFDPQDCFLAVEDDRAVGYATLQSRGRMSFPWCRPGFERHAEPLLDAILNAAAARGLQRVFAAYRKDWEPQAAFFEAHGFRKARDMVNFVQELTEMPTTIARSSLPLTALGQNDVPALLEMAPNLWRGWSVPQLCAGLFNNPAIPASAYFAVRDRSQNRLLAAGVIVLDPTFADPTAVDPWQPCFRLGTFGTEGQAAKRVNGLFSLVAAPTHQSMPVALSMMAHAASIIDANDGHAVAAQCPSDEPHLLRFYQAHFRQQGYFPVFERRITD